MAVQKIFTDLCGCVFRERGTTSFCSCSGPTVGLPSLTTQLDKKVGFKSLGEQQRIGFARVLLRKLDWVLLDEATASLDKIR